LATLKVLCARSMHVAVEAIADGFAQSEGWRSDLHFGTVGALQKRLDDGEAADVVILATTMVAQLYHAGTLRPGTRRDVARTFIAICIREGTEPPPIATLAEFEATLQAAPAVAISDPAVGGSAGIYLARLFEAMKLADVIAAKGMLQPTGAEVARRVAEGAAAFGLTLSGEIAGVPGAVIAGPLPPPIGNETTYTAAVMASSAAPEAAQAFIEALCAKSAEPIWTKAGFQVP